MKRVFALVLAMCEGGGSSLEEAPEIGVSAGKQKSLMQKPAQVYETLYTEERCPIQSSQI